MFKCVVHTAPKQEKKNQLNKVQTRTDDWLSNKCKHVKKKSMITCISIIALFYICIQTWKCEGTYNLFRWMYWIPIRKLLHQVVFVQDLGISDTHRNRRIVTLTNYSGMYTENR